METLLYISAIAMALLGGFLLLKCFIGQSSGMIGLIGFFLLMGGIASFNEANNDDEIDSEVVSSVDHHVINEEIYNRDIDVQNGVRRSDTYEGEGIDFSGVNAEHEKIRAEGDAKRQELERERRMEFERSQEANEWDEE